MRKFKRGPLVLLCALLAFIGVATPASAALTINISGKFNVSYYAAPGYASCTYGGGAVTAGEYWLGFSAYYAGCSPNSPKTVCVEMYSEKTYLGVKVPDVRVDYWCTDREFGLISEGTGTKYYYGCSTTKTYGIRVSFFPHYPLSVVSLYRGGLVCQSW